MNEMENKQKEKLTVGCSNCRTSCSGSSIESILSEMRCGKDGAKINDACKTTLRSDSKNLFKVVPVQFSPSTKKVEKDVVDKKVLDE